MATQLPLDLYPVATDGGTQIRQDLVRPLSLDSLAFNSTVGSVLSTTLVAADDAVIFYSSQDCIVAFDSVATNPPAGILGFLLLGGERANIVIPQGITGISVIGLIKSGTLYINKIVKWAGLGNASSGVS